MKRPVDLPDFHFLIGLAALALVAAPVASAQLAAGNVRAAQRTGTKLVDIQYDLSGITTPVTVTLEISADGGTTWTVPATTLTGAIGSDITPGTNLLITWNAGTDWDNQTSSQTRFRIQTSDPAAIDHLARIPAGSFTMGDALDGDTNAPAHAVYVSSFYMQKKEVTKSLWSEVRDWAKQHNYPDISGGAGKSASHPVQKVTWYDVVKWCNAQSEKSGLTPCYYTDAAQTTVYRNGNENLDNTMVKWTANGYRLPTEAEWEMAARGGLSGKRFPWGDTITHSQANYFSSTKYTYDVSPTRGSHPLYSLGVTPYTAPVGSFSTNGFGLHDMAGNVREWCWDFYDAAYYLSSPAADPHGPAAGLNRMLRGGDWSYYAYGSRVAYRYIGGTPDARSSHFGFRPVRTNLVSAQSADVTVDTREWLLTTSTLSHGSINGVATDGKYLAGSTATLTAVPLPGYSFTGWSGAATGTANPLALLMDSNKTIGAGFTPDASDADGDGLSAYDEAAIYGTNPTLADTDGDGLTDGYEAGLGRFSIIAGSFTWAQARADAHSRGGELACFPTEAGWNLAIDSLGAGAADAYTGLWIGASDAATDGTWTWVNSQAFSYNQWATGRPGSAAGNTLDYAEVSGGASSGEIGKWFDRSPALTRDGYILETGYATDPKLTDTDNDGLNDLTESSVHHSNPLLKDSDGDGFDDGFEVTAGFDPALATSTPDLLPSIRTVPASIPAAVELRFNAANGISYRIEASTDLNAWNLLETDIIGQGAAISRAYPTAAQLMRFFRVRRN